MTDNIALPEPPAARTIPELPDEIQDGIEKLEAAEAGLQRIRSLIHQAQRGRADADREYKVAFATLADAEASALLDGAAPAQALRKTAQEQQGALLAHEARLVGLKTRERAAVESVESAVAVVTEARDQWARAEISEARRRFKDAAEAFVAAAAEPAAIGIGLGDGRLALISKTCNLPDTDNPGRNMADALRFYKQDERIVGVVGHYDNVRRVVGSAVDQALRAAYPAAPKNS